MINGMLRQLSLAITLLIPVGQTGKAMAAGRLRLPPVTAVLSDTIPMAGSRAEREREADSAWEALGRTASLFTDGQEAARYQSLNPLRQWRFEDAKSLRKAELAYGFWKRFPDDHRRAQALASYLSADPHFIADQGNDSPDSIETWKGLDGKAFVRSLVIDTALRNQWLRSGNEMVRVALREGTAATAERASFSLFARDFRQASRLFVSLPAGSGEHDYWRSVEAIYWASFYARFEQHALTYPASPELGSRAKDFLSTLKGYSADIALTYWRRLLALQAGMESIPAGIASLHQAAREQLYAIDIENGSVPLDMEFTALDGKAFKLSDLRGKTVLVDFWATWCKPCVEELPHVKAMHDQYRARGFEVVGICLDDESARDRAKELLHKTGAEWPQRFEGIGFNDDAYRLLYGISSLPTVWLLNTEGKIIAKNLHGEALHAKLAELLN